MITVDGVGVGLTTCYDIRFPELFTTLARRGAQLIVVSASWASGRGKLEQWTLLARARALDSTSYIVAAGQADPGEPLASSAPTGVGGSLVVSPFGDVVASAGADPQLLVTDLALEQVAKARETIAVLRNHSAFAHEIRQNRPGDESAGTRTPGPVDMGSSGRAAIRPPSRRRRPISRMNRRPPPHRPSRRPPRNTRLPPPPASRRRRTPQRP